MRKRKAVKTKLEKILTPATVLAVPVAVYGTLVMLLIRRRAMHIAFAFGISAILFYILVLFSRKVSLPQINLPDNQKSFSPKCFVFFTIMTFAVLLIYLIAFFPGGYSSDTFYQWQQVHGVKTLTDWHPALHTLFLKLLCSIWDEPVFCLVIQLIGYSLSVGYVISVLYLWSIPKFVYIGIWAYLGLNPGISNLMSFLWKDCAFAIAMLVVSAHLLQISFSDGRWLLYRRNRIVFSVFLVLTSVFRHNGLAFTLPVIVWLFISYKWALKRVLSILFVSMLLFFGIKGPLYTVAGVDWQPTPLSEIFGVPMTVLSNIAANAPDSLPEDVRIYMEDVTPFENYELYNNPGDWNDIKWNIGSVYTDRPYSLLDVYKFAVRSAQKEPDLAAEAIGYLWQMPMWPGGDAYWYLSPHLVEVFPASRHLQPFLSRALNWVARKTSDYPMAWALWCPGFYLISIMIVCVGYINKRKIRALLLPAGLIAYHFATDAVLSSSTDYRFYLGFMICAPLCILSLSCCTKEEQQMLRDKQRAQ